MDLTGGRTVVCGERGDYACSAEEGKSNPFISAEEAGGHVVSGGGIMLIGIVFGTIQLYRISGMAAVVYLAVSLMIYILIHVIFREK